MKTTIIKHIFSISAFIFVINFFNVKAEIRNNKSYAPYISENSQDTVYNDYSGIVYDAKTNKVLSFASLVVNGTNIGTVTNSDGEFLIKIPSSYRNAELQISSLGYKTLTLPFSFLSRFDNKLFLEPTSYVLEEVEIRKVDPVNLIRDVLRNITPNYGNNPLMLTAFYRETIRQNRNYVAVSEAVFDVYKSGYGKTFDSDRIKIYKGRKSQDVSRMDTVLFKLQGGPYYIFMLDIARHPGDIMSGEVLEYYDYELAGSTTIDERTAYIVAFEQKKNVNLPLYKGYFFIDIETKALIAVEFSLSQIGINKAAEYMIIKKPANMKVDVVYGDYRVNYRFAGNRWVLNYARSEAHFRCRWDRRLFRSNYFVMSEMAVTDMDASNIIKYKFRESTKPDEILVEKVSDFEDPEFWGDYNIIRPEQTIEQAIEKLGKRLKRLGEE